MDKHKSPRKPWPQFPLTPTPKGWVKKYRGRLRYVCPNGTDPHEAVKILARKIGEWDTEAESKPRQTNADEESVADLLDRWLAVVSSLSDRGKRTHGYYSAAVKACSRFAKHLGSNKTVDDLNPDDFRQFGDVLEDQYKLGPLAKGHSLRIVMAAFNFAADEDWIDRPVKFGRAARAMTYAKRTGLPMDKARTPAEAMRIVQGVERLVAKLRNGRERDLSSAEQLRAGIWLAINGGYGGADLGSLPLEVIDLDRKIIDYRRGKTKVERILPLMPETIDALRPVIGRAIARNDTLVFRTREGNPWHRNIHKQTKRKVSTTTIDNFQQCYSKLLRSLKMKRAGAGFYELKHTHSEMADAAGDVHAAMRIVGHALPFSRDPYVRVTEDRLRKVVEYIRHCLSLPNDSARTSSPSTASRRPGERQGRLLKTRKR